jgi:pimeloyl-ACP methyl ester carboxylesterase
LPEETVLAAPDAGGRKGDRRVSRGTDLAWHRPVRSVALILLLAGIPWPAWARHRYDRPDLSRAYFFPRRTPPISAELGSPVSFKLRDGARVAGLWRQHLPGAPTIFYLYGNGGTLADEVATWAQLTRTVGANLFMIDYPGYGASEGEPSFTACCHAARAGLEELVAKTSAVVLVGRSAGSTFALDAGASLRSSRVKGLVLESGIADLGQRLQVRGFNDAETLAEVSRDFDHKAKVGAIDVPTLVLHTRDDRVVPVWHGEKLAGWAASRLDALVLFPEGDHNTIYEANRPTYEAHLARFLTRLDPGPDAR